MKVWLSVTALSLVVGGASSLSAQGQSLADVATTEEAERQQTVTKPSKVLLTLMLSRAIDVSTSLAVFQQGGIERNPLILSTRPAPFLAETVLATAGEVWLLLKLHHAHPRLAKWITYIDIGASVGASMNNLRVFRSLSSAAASATSTPISQDLIVYDTGNGGFVPPR